MARSIGAPAHGSVETSRRQLADRLQTRRRDHAARQHRSWPPTPAIDCTAARRLNRAAGMIATSVLIDSAMEHYRGNFHNKAMWTPIVTSLLVDRVSAHGHRRPTARRSSRRDLSMRQPG
jgi:hypothetical protein